MWTERIGESKMVLIKWSRADGDTAGGNGRDRLGTRPCGARRRSVGARAGTDRAQDLRARAWLIGGRAVLSPGRGSPPEGRAQGLFAHNYRVGGGGAPPELAHYTPTPH